MRLLLLTSFTMLAFASNSLLTRMAVEPGLIDPLSFALIRVLAGAAFLCLLVIGKKQKLPWRGRARLVGAVSLAIYMLGFSVAYMTLDAGLGALILFGVVQISMFGYNWVMGARPTLRQLTGAGIAFCGLMIALWPEPTAPNLSLGALYMVIAGLGWAAYTLSGRASPIPLSATAANFALCFPILVVCTALYLEHVTLPGAGLAVICGALTSGLGYALWYRVLADLQDNLAPIVQLSVPIIAIVAGGLLLSEPITIGVVVAAILVISGIALAVTKQFPREDHT